MDNQEAQDEMEKTRAQLFGDEINVELLDSVCVCITLSQYDLRLCKQCIVLNQRRVNKQMSYFASSKYILVPG